nr:hypothetical protein [Actinomycetota bacterium]
MGPVHQVQLRYGGSERGYALIAALGTLFVITITSVSLVSYSTSNSRTAVRSKTDNLSFSLSEAGLANALSILNLPANDPLDPELLPNSEATASSASYEGGTAKWWGVLDRAEAVWTVYGLGLKGNPTGPAAAQVRRRLTAKVPIVPVNTQTTEAPAWNYIYARRTGNSCDMTLNNAINGSSRLYVAGNLCLHNAASVTNGPLIV